MPTGRILFLCLLLSEALGNGHDDPDAEELGDVIDYNLNNNLRPSGRAPAMDLQTLEQLRQGMLKDRA